jgi:hypothetical protein
MGGRRLYQRPPDDLADYVQLATDFIVPKSQHTVAVRLQPARSRRVFLYPVRVLTAVDFDDQLALEADEVDNISPEDVLSPKFVAVELAQPQPAPEDPLGVGGVRSQQACELALHSNGGLIGAQRIVGSLPTPHLVLPPQGGKGPS